MKVVQALLPLLPLPYHLSNLNATGAPPAHKPFTAVDVAARSPLFNNLSGGIDFSNPDVEKILTGDGQGPSYNGGGDFSTLGDPCKTIPVVFSCPDPPVLSCSAEAASTDSCCVVDPGGVLVHVQLWDLNIGEPDSFGIHGLWPDTCDGDYYENCDDSRGYSASTISQQLPTSLRNYMETYWQSNDESPEAFWHHEWETHGTCVSTLEPQCLSGYQSGAEVVPYFETVVALFKKLNTYQALSAAGITPSSSQTYAASAMQDAIESGTGYTPDLVCSHGVLTSVEFYLNARGPLQDGDFEQSAPTRSSTCPDQVSWPPKTT